MVGTQELCTLIAFDHSGERNHTKDCWWSWLMFQYAEQKSSWESSDSMKFKLDSEDDFCTGCWNISHHQQSFSGLLSLGWSNSIKESHYTQSQCIVVLTMVFHFWLGETWIIWNFNAQYWTYILSDICYNPNNINCSSSFPCFHGLEENTVKMFKG